MEAAGLVSRRPDPADRRARIVEAAEDGRRAADAARVDIEAIENRLLDDLDAPAHQALRSVLRQLVGTPVEPVERVERVEDGRQADNACAPSRA